MKLSSLWVQGFGGISDHILTFRPGVQVIYGKNEAGKTTLTNALVACLFGYDARKRRDRELSSRYKPWDGGLYAAAVEFDSVQNHFRVKRDFTENTTEGWTNTGDNWVPVNTQSAVEEAFGLSEESLFRSLLVISQTEVSQLDDKRVGEAIAVKLAGHGDDVSALRAVGILKKRLLELTRKGQTSRTEGALQASNNEVKRLEVLLGQATVSWEELSKLDETIGRFESELKAVNERYEYISPIVKRWKTAKTSQNELADASSRQRRAETKLRMISQLEARLRTANDTLTAFAGRESSFDKRSRERIETLEERRNDAAALLAERLRAREQVLKELERAKRQLAHTHVSMEGLRPGLYSEEASAKIEALALRLEDAQEHCFMIDKRIKINKTSARAKGRLAWYLALLSLLVLLCTAVIWFVAPQWGIAPVILGLVVFVGVLLTAGTKLLGGKADASMAAAFSVERRRVGDAAVSMEASLHDMLDGVTIDEYRDNRRRLVKLSELKIVTEQAVAAAEHNLAVIGVDEAQSISQDAEEELMSALENSGCLSAAEYMESWISFWGATNDISHAERELALILEGKSPEDWEREAVEAAGNIRIASETIDSSIVDVDGVQMMQLEEEIATLGRTKAELVTELNLNKGRRDQLKSSLSEDKWIISAKLDEAQSQRAELVAEEGALLTAIAVLEQAMTEVTSAVIPFVCQRASELLSTLTGGRYQALRVSSPPVGSGGLEISVIGPDGRVISPEHTSAGTKDQIYISLRLALGEHLTGRESLPFIFDDPFVHFDEDRLANAFEMLGNLGSKHQVIWLVKDRSIASRCKVKWPVYDLAAGRWDDVQSGDGVC